MLAPVPAALTAAAIAAGALPSLASAASAGSSQEDDEELRDISADVCWHGDWTKDLCCRGDPTTHPECWDGVYSFGECCPNSDCWDGGFTYEQCCGEEHGPGGNAACWSLNFNHQHCCLANGTARNWADVMVDGVDYEQFYALDEFYTDAQYGDDFGYYSKGHVLHSKLGKAGLKETQQFAHFTTYPMALSPHFARVFCRLLFVMWIHLGERTPFRVIEMGAGSGQLASDIQQCVRENAIGIRPQVWRRWASAFEYLIMERSPALAKRQRERGLRNVAGDAQTTASCQPVLAALAASPACSGPAAAESPECWATERGTAASGASVVLSNELLDAFAPVKLRLSLYGSPNITDCGAWQEVRLVHTVHEQRLRTMLEVLGHSPQQIEGTVSELRAYTNTVFCTMANTSIGIEAQNRVPENTSCLALVFGLGELVNHLDLGVPAASHNMRMRIRKDMKLWSRLREVVQNLDGLLSESVAIPRDIYRQIRHQMRDAPEVEAHFLTETQTHHVPVTIGEERCEDLTWWFQAHEARLRRLARFYGSLGYPALHAVVRPGERNFIDLADCLLGPSGGFKLSIDYGANFEGLTHSLSIDPKNDGIFVPPIPHELMHGLPECHNFWPRCAGRIDWTTFVDFTNLAAAGERLGWHTLFYGPQSLLEHMSRFNLTVDGREYSVPGYAVHEPGWTSRHVANWYGREIMASDAETGGWVQRWTSFKALLLYKPSAEASPKPVLFPSWHLDTAETDPCWNFDFTTVPLSDWIPRQIARRGLSNARDALEQLTEDVNNQLGRDYALAYEEAQLAVRLVDWLVATMGCEALRPLQASSMLNNRGLWSGLQSRMARKWGPIWGEEALGRIASSVLERLAQGADLEAHATPPACAGQQTYVALCSESFGGVGGVMSPRRPEGGWPSPQGA
eukprot:TRINITY_DN29087_c0_g1_i1.p1 TRINITY_DN29087_c0_g1~~TRINITY_DN29087_c0_g1_i1.p1  ORF type:complete len:912 (-),score=152.55 TRINITY_DN29087_c0_g1_i1:108-2843(-)